MVEIGDCWFLSIYLTPLYTVYNKQILYFTLITIPVARGAQQFRQNMSRDYELKIPQESESLVLYVRQRHLGPRPIKEASIPTYTEQAKVLDRLLGEVVSDS
jgi:hypothetical protein